MPEQDPQYVRIKQLERVLREAGFSDEPETEGEYMNMIECGLPPKAVRMIAELRDSIKIMETEQDQARIDVSRLSQQCAAQSEELAWRGTREQWTELREELNSTKEENEILHNVISLAGIKEPPGECVVCEDQHLVPVVDGMCRQCAEKRGLDLLEACEAMLEACNTCVAMLGHPLPVADTAMAKAVEAIARGK
jgi:hypothetical protein